MFIPLFSHKHNIYEFKIYKLKLCVHIRTYPYVPIKNTESRIIRPLSLQQAFDIFALSLVVAVTRIISAKSLCAVTFRNGQRTMFQCKKIVNLIRERNVLGPVVMNNIS